MHTHMHFDSHSGPSSRVLSKLRIACLVMLGFVGIEIATGIWSHSLAIFSDAANNSVDTLALVMVWWSQKIASRPPDKLRTYGYQRTNVLVALLNVAIMVPVVIDIAYRAVMRFMHPVAIDGFAIGAIGLLGLLCNLAVVLLLRSNSDKLHVRGAYLHNAADMAGSVLLMISGLIIQATGATWIDLLLALALCSLITWSMWPIARSSVHILLEGTPVGLDADEIGSAIESVQNVIRVHDLHLWTHGDGMPALTAHVCLSSAVPHALDHKIVDDIRALLRERFDITHSTIQPEHLGCEQLEHCVWNESGSNHEH